MYIASKDPALYPDSSFAIPSIHTYAHTYVCSGQSCMNISVVLCIASAVCTFSTVTLADRGLHRYNHSALLNGLYTLQPRLKGR